MNLGCVYRVLKVLICAKTRVLSVQILTSETGYPYETVVECLRELEKLGVVKTGSIGRVRIVELVRTSPLTTIVEQLIRMYTP